MAVRRWCWPTGWKVRAEVAVADVAHTVNHHRARATFGTVTRDRAQAIADQAAAAAGQHGVVSHRDGSPGPGTVFRLPGRGLVWADGRQLLLTSEVFAAAVAELETGVCLAPVSLRDVIATVASVS